MGVEVQSLIVEAKTLGIEEKRLNLESKTLMVAAPSQANRIRGYTNQVRLRGLYMETRAGGFCLCRSGFNRPIPFHPVRGAIALDSIGERVRSRLLSRTSFSKRRSPKTVAH